MSLLYDGVTKETMASRNIWLWYFVHKRYMTCWQKQPTSTICQSTELTFLTPWYAHVRVRIRGFKKLDFWKILRSYVMDDHQIKLCRNVSIQMDLSKNKHFSTQKAINYIPCTEKRKKVPVCKMFPLDPLGLCPPQ